MLLTRRNELIDNVWGGYQDPGGLGLTVWQQNDYVTVGGEITAIPEPATVVLTALAAATLVGYVKRRR